MRFALVKRMVKILTQKACTFLLLTSVVITGSAQKPETEPASEHSENSVLIESVKQGQLDKVIALLASGISPDSTDTDGNTPLCWAVRVNRLDIVETLLASKASVDLEEEDGTTALDVASASGRADFVRLLLAQGANANHKDHRGHTTLMSGDND